MYYQSYTVLSQYLSGQINLLPDRDVTDETVLLRYV